MTTFDLARVEAADRRLAALSAETGGFGVEALFVDDADRSVSPGLPDILYVNRGDPYTPTTLYDVAQDLFVRAGWGDWLECAEAERRAER